MRIFKWSVVILLVVVLGAMIHYTLPRHEVVRVVGVTERLETFGINRFFFSAVPGGMSGGESRDVRYIETVRASGGELVFRNEDTGWLWPPFYKFDAADMQARTRDMVSSSDNPRWVRITYYGIRSQIFSIYPNALRIREVDSPDASVVPWTRLVGFAVLIGLAAWVWLTLRRLRERWQPRG